MSERHSKKSYSIFSFWITAVVCGWKKSREKFGLTNYGGEDYAPLIAKMHKFEGYFDEYATKQDLVIDDDFNALNDLSAIDPRASKNWSQISEWAINLADDLDDRSRYEATFDLCDCEQDYAMVWREFERRCKR